MSATPEAEGPPLIAVVDDDRGQRELIAGTLRAAGWPVAEGASGADALALTRSRRPALMILDVRMPGMSGLEALRQLLEEQPGARVLLITAHGAVRDAVDAIRTGALDYLEKPIDLDELLVAVEEIVGPATGSDRPGASSQAPPGIVAESAAMRRVLEDASRVAPTDATVLLTGESGVGKDVIAELIHRTSRRAAGPLVRLNCAALPETLVESQLFGHERGAFTGAHESRPGDFESALGGTLFLDEIGEMPLALQPKLLRAIEARAIRRVGGSREIMTDVRIVTATNRDLDQEVAAGRFREDLLYRINVFSIRIPVLRERREDILPLADHFLRALGYGDKRLAPAAQRLLAAHAWPGNVRELRNAIERAAILARGTLILPSDLPPALTAGAQPAAGTGTVLVGDMDEIRKRAILEALERTRGNKTQAAALLGISRRALIYRLREYGL